MADHSIQISIDGQLEGAPGSSGDQNPAESTADHQAEPSSSSTTSTKKCASCGILEADPEKPLKPCSKCQTVRYCSRDCQKKDWKVHKKTCASAAQIYAQTADLKPASAPKLPKKEGHRGGLQKWQFDT